MKKLYLTIAVLLFFEFYTIAQSENDCYTYFKKSGIDFYKKSDYQTAIFHFNAILSCSTLDPKEVRKSKVSGAMQLPKEIAVLKEKAEECLKLKVEADQLYSNKEYLKSKNYYEKIVAINPDDEYCVRQVQECKLYGKPIPDGMVLVHGGASDIGSDKFTSEFPVHHITLSSFYIGKYEVTNKEFAEFLNAYGHDSIKTGVFKGQPIFLEDDWGIEYAGKSWKAKAGYENHPAIFVSWYGADAYCKWKGGRLPTEAEWEFAARGGLENCSYKYSGSNVPDSVAWYYGNSDKMTHQVGKLKPNSLGIYDMSGNAYEWCSDWFSNYEFKSTQNPQGPQTGEYKVLRGGSWYDYYSHLSVTNRGNYNPDYMSNLIGFRLVKLP